MSGFSAWAEDKRFKMLALLILILAAVALFAYSYYTWKQAKYIFSGPTTFQVMGKGEVYVKPDLATFSFAVVAEAKDVAIAQEESAKAINKIIAYLKEKGVDEKDIKTTNYSLSPKYEYPSTSVCAQGWCPPGKETLVGYRVDQTVDVKVRKTDMAGELLSGVGDNGGTNVSGLSFTVDDDEKVKDEARALAIKDAQAKGVQLAKDLGVRIVRMQSYWEENQGGYPGPMYDKAMMGVSNAMAPEALVSPSIPGGENKIISNVTITYEIQ